MKFAITSLEWYDPTFHSHAFVNHRDPHDKQ